MLKNSDILERADLRSRSSYGVPDGYFDALESRLMSIPAESGSKKRGFVYGGRLTYAIAAGVAAVLLCGVLLLRGHGIDPDNVTLYEQYAMIDLIPHTDPYSIFEDSDSTGSAPTEEELMDYLIASKVELEYY